VQTRPRAPHLDAHGPGHRARPGSCVQPWGGMLVEGSFHVVAAYLAVMGHASALGRVDLAGGSRGGRADEVWHTASRPMCHEQRTQPPLPYPPPPHTHTSIPPTPLPDCLWPRTCLAISRWGWLPPSENESRLTEPYPAHSRWMCATLSEVTGPPPSAACSTAVQSGFIPQAWKQRAEPRRSGQSHQIARAAAVGSDRRKH